jgi:tetratricopeptide (TPR) repeat protein
VEDVITAITGGMGGVPARSLRSSMERAAVEFDERTAEAFARALFSELSQNPQDLAGLESLIILGLAHPRILARHGISLETEGRRLAVVLDRGGHSARAQQLLEMLSTNLPHNESEHTAEGEDEARAAERVTAIESLLREADQCIARGRRCEAVQHLQEILKLDRDRFDIARMIRDLRRDDEGRRARRATISKIVFSMMLVGFLGYGLVLREQRVRDRWDALPLAVAGDPVALQGRLDALESLLAQEHVWGGMFQAWRERDQLRTQIQRLQDEAARAVRTAALQKKERIQNAEDVRLRGMLNVKNGRFDEALGDLRQALELGGDHWEQRQRVLADVSAIEAWKAKKP